MAIALEAALIMGPLTIAAAEFLVHVVQIGPTVAVWPSLLGLVPLGYYWWASVRRVVIDPLYRLPLPGVYVLLLGCSVSLVFGLPLLMSAQRSLDTFVYGCAPLAALHLIHASTGRRQPVTRPH